MFNIRDNLIDLQGSSTQINLTGKMVPSSLNRIIQLSQAYGTQLGYNDNVPVYKDYISVTSGKQDYDLLTDFINNRPQLTGKHIQITRLFHYALPAIVRYFDPWAGSGMGTHGMLDQFGWGTMSPSVQFTMMPIYADLLRMQAIQLNDQIRKSGYGFQMHANNVRIFPIPTTDFNL